MQDCKKLENELLQNEMFETYLFPWSNHDVFVSFFPNSSPETFDKDIFVPNPEMFTVATEKDQDSAAAAAATNLALCLWSFYKTTLIAIKEKLQGKPELYQKYIDYLKSKLT
jgi:hypothetical protein